ncbi:unnamed protein product [Urochloa decumbens]|uniref:NAC domain-containing protein n=1 Tax=Urochloa decumbens TaxID=240449 RepID=A0ABC9F5L8_9POAL
MSLISMMEARLPPGFRFHPRDDELVLDYLCRKLSGKGGGAYGGIAMVDVDLNKCEPWELPDEACVGGREWYFFSLHDRKYATGQRTNRATRSGYWKATGKDRPISISGRRPAVVGMRKTLVFYQGRAPRGSKTEWVMHEFRVEGPAVAVAARPCSPLKVRALASSAFLPRDLLGDAVQQGSIITVLKNTCITVFVKVTGAGKLRSLLEVGNLL